MLATVPFNLKSLPASFFLCITMFPFFYEVMFILNDFFGLTFNLGKNEKKINHYILNLYNKNILDHEIQTF